MQVKQTLTLEQKKERAKDFSEEEYRVVKKIKEF